MSQLLSLNPLPSLSLFTQSLSMEAMEEETPMEEVLLMEEVMEVMEVEDLMEEVMLMLLHQTTMQLNLMEMLSPVMEVETPMDLLTKQSK